jgi:hypothetical protein
MNLSNEAGSYKKSMLAVKPAKGEDSLYKYLSKYLDKAYKQGYSYTDIYTNKDKNDIELIFGNYENNKEYYRITVSDPIYGTEPAAKNVKSGVKLEKLIDYSEDEKTVKEAKTLFEKGNLELTPKGYLNFLEKIYNENKDSSLPKIKNYDFRNLALYSFAAAYGATIVTAADNSSLVNNAYYGFLHLGMLAAPFIPLQFSKKTRSLPQMISLALVSWAANSISYYPVGMIMGHTAGNLTDIINWYKFQIGLGSGSYVDKYGPISLTVSSHAKALSYAGRVGLAGILSQFGKISGKIKNSRKVVENGKME